MIKYLIGALCLVPTISLGQSIHIELNSLQAQDTSCRMVFTAQSTVGVEGLVVETALFDTSGTVMMLTLFDFTDVPAQSLRVRQFDVADQSCTQIGRILFNGIDSCAGDGCAGGLAVQSRVETVEVLG